MPKKLQLQIPSPCHENWENMTQAEKGRFCSSCQKQVIDFSHMSDRELAMFFKKSFAGSVCGRLMEDQLGRDLEIPRKRIPWLKYFFQFLLPGFLVSCSVRTQCKIKVVGEVKAGVTKKPEEKILEEPTHTMVGVLLMEIVNEKDTIPPAKEKPVGHKPKKQSLIIAPQVQLPTATKDPISVLEKPIDRETVCVEQQLGGVVGGIRTTLGGVGITRCYVNKTSGPMAFFKKIFGDTGSDNFKIYPNPVSNNSTLNIAWKQKEQGYYGLQLYSQAGQLVFKKEIYISMKRRDF